MICNKCGTENDDDQRFCVVCGHKLRSRERGAEPDSEPPFGQEDSASGPEPDIPEGAKEPTAKESGTHGTTVSQVFLEPMGMDRRPSLGGLAFAWALALLLAVAAAWSAFTGVTWPLYPLTAAVALLAWLRKL
ncbi:MAG: zinc ribbon domain-containing protein [Desulfovibrio sp.]|nr:zinc ribbon domain-containing protein [Desulfovibrio sp.]